MNRLTSGPESAMSLATSLWRRVFTQPRPEADAAKLSYLPLLGSRIWLGPLCSSELDIHPPNELLRRLGALGTWNPGVGGQIRSQHLIERHALRNQDQHTITHLKNKISLRDDRAAGLEDLRGDSRVSDGDGHDAFRLK